MRRPVPPVPWFRCDPFRVRYNMAGLLWQEGMIYIQILLRVHEAGEPIDVKAIPKIQGIGPGTVTNAIRTLCRGGIVLSTEDGRLDIPGARDELKWRRSPEAYRLAELKRPVRTTPPNWAAIRQEIFARDGYVCAYCATEEGPFEIDHVYPVARGGGEAPGNLCVACRPCNNSKRDHTVEEWLAILERRYGSQGRGMQQ